MERMDNHINFVKDQLNAQEEMAKKYAETPYSKGNPLKTETPFGIPVAVSVGDILTEADDLRDKLDDVNSRGMEDRG